MLAILFLAVGLAMDAFAAALTQGTQARPRPRATDMLRIGLAFGIAQGLMPAIGWWLGQAFERFIRDFDHWVAFVLLVAIGVSMIRAARRQSAKPVDAGDPSAASTADFPGRWSADPRGRLAAGASGHRSAVPAAAPSASPAATPAATPAAASSAAPSADRASPVARGWPLFALAIATSIDAAAAGVTLAFLDQSIVAACVVIGFVTLGLCIVGVWAGAAAGRVAGPRAQVFGGIVLIGLGAKILIEHAYFGG
jgi:putative Mn2+ efflux pump MntP